MGKVKDEARELVKRLAEVGQAEKAVGKTLEVEGEMVRVSRTDDGVLRFDLDGVKRGFVMMSGRLYEREYVSRETERDEESEVKEEGKAEEAAQAEAEPNATGEEAPADPIVEQLNYQGEMERVDTRLYRNRLVCGCGNVRWVKNADLFQVKKCKPCTLKERRERRRKGKA